jgi:hypothetical protein
MDNSVRAEAYLNRYAMMGTITRLQDRHSEEGYDGYCSPADGYGSHHNSSDLSSSSSPEQSISPARHSHTLSSPHGRNLGRRSSHSNSRTPPQYERSSRSSRAMPQRMGTTPSSDHYLYHGSSNSHVSVSLHDHTSPAGGHHHGSHSHRTGSSTASYASGQSRGSCGHSSSHSRSLSRTANTTDAHQTLLNSTSSVKASKTSLRSNVFPNESSYDEDSGTGLESLPANNQAATHASASCTCQGEEESVPGQIDTSQGSTNVSPEGHTQDTGALYQSDQRSNIPSVVSNTPEHHPPSRRSSQQTSLASRTSSRLNRGCREDDRMNL